MIKVNFNKFFYDRVWFGVVYFKQTFGQQGWLPHLVFLGWQMAFIPIRRRNIPPPKWYLKLFNIGYRWMEVKDLDI